MQQANHQPKPILVAGPCSAENREQILFSLEQAQARNVDFVRISLWKPRTKPGFDGLKEEGIPLLVEAAQMGINPATEVLVAEQAQAVMDQVLPALGPNGQLMLWIGARNQNHYVQRGIAQVAAQDSRVKLMVKNQPWHSDSHWEGIVEHALEGGIAPENLVLCHRGFTPDVHNPNPSGLRNVADSDLAMQVRAKTKLPMLLDVSHIAGSTDKIEEVAMDMVEHAYDGLVIEVHPNPRFAWTDAKQQITWDELDILLGKLQASATLGALERNAILA
jgi:chorismate mutase